MGKIIQIMSAGRFGAIYALTDEGLVYFKHPKGWMELKNQDTYFAEGDENKEKRHLLRQGFHDDE